MIWELNDDDMHRYLEMWRDQEGFSDINLFLDQGYTMLAAKTLVEAGAIDPEFCFEDAKEMEAYILKQVEGYKKKQYNKDLKACMKNVTVWVNDSNEHYFIHPDYFVDDADLIEWGFKKLD